MQKQYENEPLNEVFESVENMCDEMRRSKAGDGAMSNMFADLEIIIEKIRLLDSEEMDIDTARKIKLLFEDAQEEMGAIQNEAGTMFYNLEETRK